MGGLVGRYALASMRRAGENSQTNLLITHDSPHRGANIPLGFQHVVRWLTSSSLLNDIFPILGQSRAMLEAPASEQMLMIKSTEISNYKLNTWMNTVYKPMVSFTDAGAQGFRIVAGSLGSECGVPVVEPGSSLLWAHTNLSYYQFLNPIGIVLLGKVQWNLGVSFHALPASGTAEISRVYFTYTRKLFNLAPFTIRLINRTTHSPSGGLPAFDSAPGGYWPLSTLATFAIPQYNKFLISLGGSINMARGFSFVSAASALDVDDITGSSLSSSYNIYNPPPNNSRITTFVTTEKDGATGEENRSHPDVTSRIATFYSENILGAAVINPGCPPCGIV